jgi:hypothetical protein
VINRFGLSILVSAAQLGAAVLALGRPDPGQGLAFLGGGLPTAGEALAAVQLLVWAIVLGSVAWNLGTISRQALVRAAAGRRLWEGSVLATGLLILAAGAAHHITYDAGLTGGSVQEAQSAIAR